MDSGIADSFVNFQTNKEADLMVAHSTACQLRDKLEKELLALSLKWKEAVHESSLCESELMIFRARMNKNR